MSWKVSRPLIIWDGSRPQRNLTSQLQLAALTMKIVYRIAVYCIHPGHVYNTRVSDADDVGHANVCFDQLHGFQIIKCRAIM